ncbi:hypothetical protein JNUCC31_29415 [Paenibacillus sp. JNUCC31]|uniref:hypothetical protein n=1 Tax=Paenibacillus sp. JNUCC-31 TaxID=2777983 RepID=UPI001782DBF6|nr:hypothetical protein [Paenibacillus sp. JNUCC-31]QOS78764.1 hypothetical protein JNUCC31_29415 [Paenibacillus sp. JNUCC-31]
MPTLATTYSVSVDNKATYNASLAIYQVDPNLDDPNVLTLAWLVKPSTSGSTTAFTWEVEYDFYWTEVDNPKPGTTITSTATREADLTSNNMVLFSHADGGTYQFSEATSGPKSNILYVHQDDSIVVADNAYIGIQMDNKPVVAVKAQPNTKTEFTPHPTYYMVYGRIEPGEIIDISEYADVALKLTFDGVTSHSVTLSEHNQFHLNS